MLIICNGAFKSGSSWLHAVLIELLKVQHIQLSRIPDSYTNDINSPTKIIESKLDDFVLNESFDNRTYITKSHFFKESTLSSPYPENVKFIFVERDMKDAIVSHYYHIRHKFRIGLGFNLYYQVLGKYKAYEIYLFNKRCKRYFGEDNFISYHDLKNRFSDSIERLCQILDIDKLDSSQSKDLMNETTIEKLREKSRTGQSEYYPSKRKDNWRQFRKGKEGDWVNYFSDQNLLHIKRTEEGKMSVSLKMVYFILFTLRRILGRIE